MGYFFDVESSLNPDWVFKGRVVLTDGTRLSVSELRVYFRWDIDITPMLMPAEIAECETEFCNLYLDSISVSA